MVIRNIELCLADITPPGFSLYQNPGLCGRAGGMAFMVFGMFSVEVCASPQYQSFKALRILVKHLYTGNSANAV